MRSRLTAALLILVAADLFADTCAFSMGPWSVRSPNGEWRLVVAPRHATLLESNKPRAHWKLVNKSTVGPMMAMVANDGTSITFGNGCSEGPSDSDVVIYRPDGKLVRRLGMRDFLLAEDLAVLPRSVSSTHWSGMHRVDEDKKQLVLEVKGPPHQFVMPISLETGDLLVPLKRHFFVPEYEPVVTMAAAPDDGRCDGASELSAHAIDQRLPAYASIAWKARIQGDVTVEVEVTEAGAVDSVRIVKPLPFGLDAAVLAVARQWRFGPLERATCGRFVTHFAIRQLPPPAID